MSVFDNIARLQRPLLTELPPPAQAFLAKHGDKLRYALLGASAVYLLRIYFAGGKAKKADLQRDLTGKVAIVTGGNSGIGYETALQLAKQNATVCVAVRPSDKTTAAVIRIRNLTQNTQVWAEDLDVSNMKSVRAFAARWRKSGRKIHWLINNAGMGGVPKRTLTNEGFELVMATNHLGHFLLTNLLLDIIKSSGNARIINVSSRGHDRGNIDFNDLTSKDGYNAIKIYSDTKLANIMFTSALARRLKDTDVVTSSLHPGLVRTDVFRNVPPLVRAIILGPFAPVWYLTSKSAWQGAQTTLHCALSPAAGLITGAYWSDCKVAPVRAEQGRSVDAQERLWSVSARDVGLE
ncbi:hypothetical protein HDV00_003437 [Rhizophlyctis rosea]|nr:hypothetical protein HDV00_003437 [Rhizophlyctis rosea]